MIDPHHQEISKIKENPTCNALDIESIQRQLPLDDSYEKDCLEWAWQSQLGICSSEHHLGIESLTGLFTLTKKLKGTG